MSKMTIDETERHIVTSIQTEEELDHWLEKNVLLVIDIHEGWSGNTETMIPTIKSILSSMSTNDNDQQQRIFFLSMSKYLKKVVDGFKKIITDGDGASGRGGGGSGGQQKQFRLDDRLGGCSPLFVIVRSRKILAVVEGADPPRLKKMVETQIAHNEVSI